jgi:hypothetical protein
VAERRRPSSCWVCSQSPVRHTQPPGRCRRPAFTARAYLAALTASGPTTALATVERGRCVVRFHRLGTSAKPGLLRPPSPCGGPDSEAVIDDLWPGRSGIAAETYDFPSPHGEAFAYLAGP